MKKSSLITSSQRVLIDRISITFFFIHGRRTSFSRWPEEQIFEAYHNLMCWVYDVHRFWRISSLHSRSPIYAYIYIYRFQLLSRFSHEHHSSKVSIIYSIIWDFLYAYWLVIFPWWIRISRMKIECGWASLSKGQQIYWYSKLHPAE